MIYLTIQQRINVLEQNLNHGDQAQTNEYYEFLKMRINRKRQNKWYYFTVKGKLCRER